ncbi:MAG TPA: hypothetical protein VFQ38_17455 [Longimicrobiales bacterium]|nr:hypothetical protein [Longimicrobiales bacterium]
MVRRAGGPGAAGEAPGGAARRRRGRRSGALSATATAGGNPPATGGEALRAALSLEEWIRAREYRGYDPHDLLASPLVRALTLGNRWLAVAWTQLGKRSPLQLRPLLGVPRTENPKTLALCLAAELRLAAATGERAPRERAAALVRRLAAARGADGGWGYPFPWANRSFLAPAGTGSAVVSAFVGHALLDAAERLDPEGAAGPAATERLIPGEAAALAAAAGDFVRARLRRVAGPEGTFAFSYTPLDTRVVHNASVLAASLLARLAARGEAPDAAAAALAAARFTAAAQAADGSWRYGAAGRDGWVDSFHTGYTLIALREIGLRLGTAELEPAVRRGLEYWHRTFLGGPAVRFHPGSDYPIDMHAVAQAILTLLAFQAELPDATRAATRLARWSVREMRAGSGHYYYLKGRAVTNRLPYMRWVQAWVLRALSELAVVEAGAPAVGAGA